jgi:superfamily II DNA/RNA helicase
MPQPKRMEMLAKFKAGEADLLVCSDVAARGLDISAVSHVINFDVPFNAEDYVHRIGRTGRAGMQGNAVTIATPYESKALAAIEALIKSPIPILMEAAIEDLKVPMQSGEAPREGRGGRGRGGPERGGSDRGGRGRDKKPSRDHGRHREQPSAVVPPVIETQTPEQIIQPVAEIAAEPAATPETPPVREHRPRPERKNPRQRDKWARDAGRMEHADDVVGFGTAIPAFLQVAPTYLPAEPDDLPATSEENEE